MESSKHTPGPWESIRQFSINGDQDHLSYDIRPASWNAGRLAVVTEGNAEPEPNARLIAAAPELLEALKLVRDNARDDSPEMWDKVNSAIAKATG
jgi:hypothetical protein